MNMWGLTPEFFQILESGFEAFVANTPADNLKAEYLLPTIIGDLLAEKKLAVKVLKSKPNSSFRKINTFANNTNFNNIIRYAKFSRRRSGRYPSRKNHYCH
jgi:hypothetical protein